LKDTQKIIKSHQSENDRKYSDQRKQKDEHYKQWSTKRYTEN